MQPGHRKTRKVYDRDGDAHFMTFSCFRRLPLLSKERTCQWMAEAIDLSRHKNPFDLWAWVIMPEHVHLVLLPHSEVRIASILTTMKQSVSRRAMNWLKEHSPDYLERLLDLQPNGKQSHRFWQRGGGYDRNLRSTRDVHEKIMYVHQNPVKRGLVSAPEEWKWSSARSWTTGFDVPIVINRESVPALSVLDDGIGSKLFDRCGRMHALLGAMPSLAWACCLPLAIGQDDCIFAGPRTVPSTCPRKRGHGTVTRQHTAFKIVEDATPERVTVS